MAEDYQQRKLAKKKRKREGQDERPEGKRVRSKKNRTRRICRGLCYKDPMPPRSNGVSANGADDEIEDVGTAAAPPKPKRRRRRKDENAIKQSTSIEMLASSQSADAQHASNPYAGAVGALSPYPKAIQDYMLDQKFTGPTPVQDRCDKASASLVKSACESREFIKMMSITEGAASTLASSLLLHRKPQMQCVCKELLGTKHTDLLANIYQLDLQCC